VNEIGLTPYKATTKINKILDTIYPHVHERFPVDIEYLAINIHSLFNWSDPISQIACASIDRFEGALFKNNDKSWTLLYNNTITSKERIRFTQAHEIGHYVLHRMQQDEFTCSINTIRESDEDGIDIEDQANQFASNLLIPIGDFRKLAEQQSFSFEFLSFCTNRYRVSLEAILIKWLDITNENIVAIISIDGFMKWSYSSRKAYRAKAFFPTRKKTISIPERSLCANHQIPNCLDGSPIQTCIWFEGAAPHGNLTEYKLFTERLDRIITILKLPRDEELWYCQS
jgi:Zn-dependent peptidase ImmA (M78 family)